MHITAIDLYHVNMPLIYPFRTAFGNDDAIESVFVKLTTDDGYGWGESAPWRLPAYSPEWAAGVFLLLREVLAPRVLGQEITSSQELSARLAGVKGNPFAKAALDAAWWDLHARAQGLPLWRTLGGTQNPVPVGADFGVMETIDALLAEIDTAVKAGFKRVKLKYRPGWELEMVAAVRDAFPDTVFHVDCNSAYRLDALPMFKQLDRYNLAMIEQPLANDDLVDHATLQAALATPVCLDESITGPEAARKAIQIGACRWVNIKPGRVGGITNAVAVHDVCRDAGIPCWIGGMLESALGGMICVALATLPNIRYPSDIFPTSRFYHRDLSQPDLALSGPSEFTAPDTPGTGAEPDPDRLAEFTVQRASLSVK